MCYNDINELKFPLDHHRQLQNFNLFILAEQGLFDAKI
jgi:hypothetical protein